MFQKPTGFCPHTTRPFCFGKRTQHNGFALRDEPNDKRSSRRTMQGWPCHDPSGALRGSPTPAARKLAEPVLSLIEGLKHCPPFLRCRLPCSAMPPGQGSVVLEVGPTRMAQTRPASSSERPLMGPAGRHQSMLKKRVDGTERTLLSSKGARLNVGFGPTARLRLRQDYLKGLGRRQLCRE